MLPVHQDDAEDELERPLRALKFPRDLGQLDLAEAEASWIMKISSLPLQQKAKYQDTRPFVPVLKIL